MAKVVIRMVNTKHEHVQETLYNLQKRCLPGDEPYDVTKGWWWIAYENDKPIAFAGLVRSRKWGDSGYLCRSGVLFTYRGMGLQNRLIQVRIRKARALGFNWVTSDTHDNPASSNSLINKGFKLYDPSEPYGDIQTLYWRKKLNAV